MTNDNPTRLPESPQPDDPVEERDELGDAAFPVVGVGASAGGLEAFTQLLEALPADTGMVFVLVQHLARAHPSALAEIMSRATKMPVMEVHDEPTVEPNHVYVIPPDRSMIIVLGALQLLPREGGSLSVPKTNFVIALSDELVGAVGFALGNDIERVDAEVGYWLGEAVWGRGLPVWSRLEQRANRNA